MLAASPIDDQREKSTIMTQLADGAEANMAVLAVHNLKKIARETSTDVEGAVAWLQSSYNPADAMDMLLKRPADMATPNSQAGHVHDLSWVS